MPVSRIAVALVWLGVAYLCQRSSARSFVAYTGAIIACVHVLGAVVGIVVQKIQGGYDFSGLAVGIALGAIAGGFIGRMATQSDPVYWAAHLVAAGFLIYLPLF